MEKRIEKNRGRAAAPAIIAILGLLAGCAPATQGPAPVVYGTPPGGVPGGGVAGAVSGPPAATPPVGAVVVQPGQSLSMIARDHHLRWPELAAANRLAPPYRVHPGQRLVIPAPGPYAAAPPPLAAPVRVAALPPPRPPAPPQERSRPSAPSAERPKPLAVRPPHVIALDRPHPAAPAGSFARPIPLDNPLAARSKPAEPHEAATPRGGDFLWPVRGPIVEGFGAGPGGTRNEGINIAAPRGAPVRAADAGVVAYVGNQLRGYGNLILIKHPEGWISAYAHCGTVLVKSGEKVRRGQIIARIGATGDVKEPQLHFELRRGKKAVDPRPLLGAPARAAETRAARAG